MYLTYPNTQQCIWNRNSITQGGAGWKIKKLSYPQNYKIGHPHPEMWITI